MSLRRHAFVAVGSNAVLTLTGDVVRLVTMMIMARLLTPDDYGTFALAISVMFWVGSVGFGNFAPNLLRHRGGKQEVGTYLLFGLFLQTGLLLVGIGVAALLFFWFDKQLVAALLALCLLSFPVQVPHEIEYQILQREFLWRRLRLIQLGTVLLGSALSVLLAYAGAGPFALAASVLLGPLPFAVHLLATRSIGPLRFDRELLRGVYKFGWPMAGGTVTWRTRELMGSWAVATFLSVADLGLLNRATGLAVLVLGQFASPVTNALLPILAAAQDDPVRRLRMGSLLLRFVVWTQIPLAVCLALLAAPAVRLLYGPRWEAAVPLLPFASALALVIHVLTLFMLLLVAAGATRERLVSDAIFFAAAFVALGGLAFGLSAYLLAQTVAVLTATVYAGHAAHRRGWIDGLGIRAAVLPALAAALFGALAAWLVRTHIDETFGAIAAAVVFVAVDLLALRLLFVRPVEELVAIMPKAELFRRILLLVPNPNVVAPGTHA